MCSGHAGNMPQMDSPLQTDENVQIYRLLLRTALRLKRRMRSLVQAYGLTGTQFAALNRIPDDGCPLTELADRLWVDPGNASGVINRLVEAGLVQRERSRKDRRVVWIRRTSQGQRLLDEMVPLYKTAIGEMLGVLGGRERQTLRQLLDKIQAAAGKDVIDRVPEDGNGST